VSPELHSCVKFEVSPARQSISLRLSSSYPSPLNAPENPYIFAFSPPIRHILPSAELSSSPQINSLMTCLSSIFLFICYN
jgi:hypothetical protein